MGLRPHQRGWGAQVDVSGGGEVGEAPSEAPIGVLSIPPLGDPGWGLLIELPGHK